MRDFLLWAATAGHARRLTVPTTRSRTGPSGSDEQRWAQVRRLLHDDTLELTDRVAGTLLLLYGQQLSRIAAMTTDQIITQADKVFLRFGRDDVHIPEPLAGCFLPWSSNAAATSASAHRPAAAGCFPACNPAGRSPPPASANACAPSTSAPNPDAARR